MVLLEVAWERIKVRTFMSRYMVSIPIQIYYSSQKLIAGRFVRHSCMLCYCSFLLLSVHLRKIFFIKVIHLWFHVERHKFLYFMSYLKTGYYNILSQDRLNPRYFPTLMLHQCVIMHSYVLELRDGVLRADGPWAFQKKKKKTLLLQNLAQ